jgi:tetratricopeptide (TPR) repeat protein
MKVSRKLGIPILLVLLVLSVTGGLFLRSNWYTLHVGWALYRNRPDEVVVWCTKGLKASLNAEKRCGLYSVRAMAYMMKQDVGGATNDFNEAILLCPLWSPPDAQVATLYVFRGMLRAGVCDREGSLVDFNRAATLNPTDYQPFLLRAAVEMKSFGEYGKAMRDVNEALRLSSVASGDRRRRTRKSEAGLSDILDMRGYVRVNLEQYDAARSDFEAALERKTRSDAFVGLAMIALARRDYHLARLHCESAMRVSNEDPHEAYALLGRVAVCEERNQEAREDFTRADSQWLIAVLDFSQGKIEASLSTLGELVSTQRCLSAELLESYGSLLFVVGRETEAQEYLQKAATVSELPGLALALLVISDGRAGIVDPNKSQRHAKLDQLSCGTWPVRLERLSLGDASLDEVLQDSETQDPQIRKQHAGGANYIAGEMALKRGDGELARGRFQEAVKSCRPDTLAYVLASTRLKTTSQRSGGR